MLIRLCEHFKFILLDIIILLLSTLFCLSLEKRSSTLSQNLFYNTDTLIISAFNSIMRTATRLAGLGAEILSLFLEFCKEPLFIVPEGLLVKATSITNYQHSTSQHNIVSKFGSMINNSFLRCLTSLSFY